MNVHKSARLPPRGRGILVSRLERAEHPTDVATAMGVCVRTVYMWRRRYREEGLAGLQDRSSRPLASPDKTPDEVEERVVALRKERCSVYESGVTTWKVIRRAHLVRHKNMRKTREVNGPGSDKSRRDALLFRRRSESGKEKKRRMPKLFGNAVESIQLGVEDFQANDSRRASSAVRNFYAGLLLLAKEVLVRAVPDAEESEIIAAHYKPIPDGSGGVKYVGESQRTIDLMTIGSRFKDFGLSIDHAALSELSRIRNDIEHHYPKVPHDAVRQAIAKAFPVAAALFRLAGEEPYGILGETWETMLEVRTVYEQELKDCRATFEKVDWRSGLLEDAPRTCPQCQSDLVAQDDPHNTDQEGAQAHCRSCGAEIYAETLLENAIAAYLDWQSYVAMTDGGDAPLHDCPECGLAAYILTEEEVGCVWCGCVLGECARCMTGLMPDNVDPDNHNLCGYCGHLMAKDD